VNEQIIIRLGSTEQQAVDWLVWSSLTEEVIASGRLADATELPALAQRLGQRPVTALVPACDVILKTVPLPSKPNRQLLQALPFMLEEDQAEDIEQLLILPAKTLEQDKQYLQQVAVLSRQKLELWLSWLQPAGFLLQRMLPDALLLPELEHQPVAIELAAQGAAQSQWLLKQGPWQVSCVEQSWWPEYLALLQLPSVLSYSPWPAHVLQPHQLAPAELPLALLARQLPNQTFNLLQGEYAPKKPQNKYWQQWQQPILLAGASLVLYLGAVALEAWQFKRQAEQFKAQAAALYKSQFPGERVVDLNRQVKRKLAAAGGTDPNQSFLGLLATVQPLLAQQPELVLDNLRFDGRKAELKFQATAASFQSFEQLKTQLQQQGFLVEQGALSNIGGKVQGTISLRGKS
jgi:general secretion pathway protein L